MAINTTSFNGNDVSLSFITYLKYYKFRLEEFVMSGIEEWDNGQEKLFTKPLYAESRSKIIAELERVEFILRSFAKYESLHPENEQIKPFEQ